MNWKAHYHWWYKFLGGIPYFLPDEIARIKPWDTVEIGPRMLQVVETPQAIRELADGMNRSISFTVIGQPSLADLQDHFTLYHADKGVNMTTYMRRR